MKKSVLIIAFLFAGIITVQTKCQTRMQKAFSIWGQGKMTKAPIT
jgi:hypothetical protein